MSANKNPCLSLALSRLNAAGAENMAIWVLKAPYPGGMVHHDTTWSKALTQTWLAWQEMFSLRELPHIPLLDHTAEPTLNVLLEHSLNNLAQTPSYSSILMQRLGIELWQWLFQGAIQNTLDKSQGIAMGQGKPLRLRLEVRDPNFIPLPWEIMQPMVGKQAISLSQQLLFSRTTIEVDSLQLFSPSKQSLRILLVLGQTPQKPNFSAADLQLEQEAEALIRVLKAGGQASTDRNNSDIPVACHVKKLLQPTPAQLIEALETDSYNIMFYAGHGEPAPDGGLLFVRPDAAMSGTELAQVLVRTQVTLAVFNACWGAQPDQLGSQTFAHSSLAEVLIQQGMPAVLGMRDSIADQEALSFIQALAQALAARMPIDQAVAVARQQLLTIYKYNQPAWTLPVLYMHPEFDGDLIKPIEDNITELPSIPPSWIGSHKSVATVRSLESTDRTWRIRGGLMRVGRSQDNDLVIPEQWVSQKHAEIICRCDGNPTQAENQTYFLRDFSRNGTMISHGKGWQKVNHQEVPLQSGLRLKFGSAHGQVLEFLIESQESSSKNIT